MPHYRRATVDCRPDAGISLLCFSKESHTTKDIVDQTGHTGIVYTAGFGEVRFEAEYVYRYFLFEDGNFIGMFTGSGHGESLLAFCLEVLSRIPLRGCSLYVDLYSGCYPAAFRMFPVLINKGDSLLVSFESRKLTDDGE